MQKIVVYVGPPDGFKAACEVLASSADMVHVASEAEPLACALAQAHALLDASMKIRITNEMIDSSPLLRIISCATTGSDHISRESLDRRGVPVRTLREDPELLQNLTPAAELSWALLMACARRLPAAVNHVQKGGWTREMFPGIMLNGRCLGLIGCGRIGGWMARYGQAFGMKVIGYDPHLDTWPDMIHPVSLDELMESSDFISIHVHLNAETQGMISRDLLEKIKPGAVLINTSRGAIVDEDALLDGLRAGRIHGVGLDVLVGEPDTAKHPLVRHSLEHDNIVITPHCGGFSPDAVRAVCAHAARKIHSVLASGEGSD